MLKTVLVKDVRLGMYIHELKGAWINHPFWRRHFVLKDPDDLQKLQESLVCEVVIDLSQGLDVLPPSPSEAEPVCDKSKNEAAERRVSAKKFKQVTVDEEQSQAAKIIASSRHEIESMFSDLRMGKAIQVKTVLPIVEEISASVSRNMHALVSLVRLKTIDDCTYMHSIAVCALMTALARALELSETEVKQAGLAGLMHDVGKAGIPLEILNKPGALTEQEFEVVRHHPKLGHDMLIKADITDPATLEVCLHHHEKMDGSGYPEKLVSDQIGLFARMGAVCDVYDAVTSTRPYKPAWEPGIALKRMANWQGHFDMDILKAFVKSLGIYPIGTVVILKSGLLAVVVRQAPASLLKPVVKAFFSTKSKLYIPVMELDLSKGMDEIVGNESAETWGLGNVDHLWAIPTK
ncbi:HD-GYP domain-containing protein [Methylophilus sp. Leaf414]|uniref:HD-GYP domain-containing protein n=1 Tax=Methylophilus sp. Leaf414 TaxID=1736371 RepID=UPI0007023732|nr:HD-GYP domain-containing protein [Methylophilus sp. Leaf414]KQT36809.1 phosphodiesterase [Methylophilus sp. Leaf414]